MISREKNKLHITGWLKQWDTNQTLLSKVKVMGRQIPFVNCNEVRIKLS